MRMAIVLLGTVTHPLPNSPMPSTTRYRDGLCPIDRYPSLVRPRRPCSMRDPQVLRKPLSSRRSRLRQPRAAGSNAQVSPPHPARSSHLIRARCAPGSHGVECLLAMRAPRPKPSLSSCFVASSRLRRSRRSAASRWSWTSLSLSWSPANDLTKQMLVAGANSARQREYRLSNCSLRIVARQERPACRGSSFLPTSRSRSSVVSCLVLYHFRPVSQREQ